MCGMLETWFIFIFCKKKILFFPHENVFGNIMLYFKQLTPVNAGVSCLKNTTLTESFLSFSVTGYLNAYFNTPAAIST